MMSPTSKQKNCAMPSSPSNLSGNMARTTPPRPTLGIEEVHPPEKCNTNCSGKCCQKHNKYDFEHYVLKFTNISNLKSQKIKNAMTLLNNVNEIN